MVSCKIELGLKGFRRFLIIGKPEAIILSVNCRSQDLIWRLASIDLPAEDHLVKPLRGGFMKPLTDHFALFLWLVMQKLSNL